MKLFVSAGEASGDALGGAFLRSMNEIKPGFTFSGIGGEDMAREGLVSLFPMSELSLMGIAEIAPKIPHLLKRVRETAETVLDGDYDALLTIDSPDFSLRVAKIVKAARPDFPTIHYVAPSVWAWRPKRAQKMAKYIDHVLTLLPFEPPYMEAAGMSADFVGHPIANFELPTPSPVFVARYKTDETVLLLPGSRRGEIERLLPIYLSALEKKAASYSPQILLVAVNNLRQEIETIVKNYNLKIEFISPEDKWQAFQIADWALATSGTVSLELAKARVPMMIGYRANALTEFMVKRMVKLPSATLVNLLYGENIVPEYLFENCNQERLAQGFANLSKDNKFKQIAAFDKVIKMLGEGEPDMKDAAARSVMQFLATR